MQWWYLVISGGVKKKKKLDQMIAVKIDHDYE